MNVCNFVKGERIIVRNTSNSYREAEVLMIRPSKKNKYECYVHYIGQDKRMDEWIPQENIDMNSRYESNIENVNDNESSICTRGQKRKYNAISNESPKDSISEMSILEEEFTRKTRIRNIDTIEFGDYVINTWYYSPYPNEYKRAYKLFICEFCLKYMKYGHTYYKHQALCTNIKPPGVEIYQNDGLFVYEIDGSTDQLYCQNLSLLAKLFLDQKTTFYHVAPFMFYVLAKLDEEKGNHNIIGYFSKEKVSVNQNNLACILILPPFQGQGYGKFMISLSYELSKLEGVIGGPEKPLSDLGWCGYLGYWEQAILNYMYDRAVESKDSSNTGNPQLIITLTEISEATFIIVPDILAALQYGSRNIMKCYDKSTGYLYVGRQSLLSIHDKDDPVQKPLQDTQQNKDSDVSPKSSNKKGENGSGSAGSIRVGGVDVSKLKWKRETKAEDKKKEKAQ